MGNCASHSLECITGGTSNLSDNLALVALVICEEQQFNVAGNTASTFTFFVLG